MLDEFLQHIDNIDIVFFLQHAKGFAKSELRELATPKYDAVRQKMMALLSPYHPPPPRADQNEQRDLEAQYIKDCYDLYQRSFQYNGHVPALLYRLRESRDCKDRACSDLLGCPIGEVSQAKMRAKSGFMHALPELLNLKTPQTIEEIKRIPFCRALLALERSPEMMQFLDKRVNDLIQISQSLDRHIISLFESINRVSDRCGDFRPALKGPRATDYYLSMYRILCSQGTDQEKRDRIVDETCNRFNWQGDRQDLETRMAELFATYGQPLTENLANYDKSLSTFFDMVALQHPFVTHFYGVQQTTGQLSENGNLYTLGQTGHTLDKNMVWLLAHIHQGHSFPFCCDMNDETIFRKSADAEPHTPSAFANEIAGLIQCGYHVQFSADKCFLHPPLEDGKPDLARLRQVKLTDIQHDMHKPDQQAIVISHVDQAKHQKAAALLEAMKAKQHDLHPPVPSSSSASTSTEAPKIEPTKH